MRFQMRTIILALLAAMLMTAGALAAEVSQGKTLAFDAAAKRIQIEEYDTNFTPTAPYGQPTGIVSDYDLSKAKVGIHPDLNDVVRIAYNIEGDRKVAIKVMNVTKQDLRRK
jgi:hypothetical protein